MPMAKIMGNIKLCKDVNLISDCLETGYNISFQIFC